MTEQDLHNLRKAIEVAKRAKHKGNEPYGAVLADAQGKVLAEAENTQVTEQDCTGHAETNLLRQIAGTYSPEELAGCTLYASAEPCPMCAGAIFWSGVGRLVFALSHQRFYASPAASADQLPIGCREILARGNRPLRVEGPALEEESLAIVLNSIRS